MKRKLSLLAVLAAVIIIGIILSDILRACHHDVKDKANAAPSTAAETVVAAAPAVVKSPLLTMGAGEEAVFPSEGSSSAAYTSDDPGVLTVDPKTGKLTAAAPGYATVTLKANGASSKCYVTVKKAPTRVAFGNKQVSMQKGESAQLTLSPTSPDEGFAGASYRSSADSVVSVTGDGAVTAKAAGKATITATVYNGKSADVAVTVLDNTGFTDKTTIAPTGLMEDASWSSRRLADVPAQTKAEQYGVSDDGRWYKVKVNGKYGWLYNKAFEETANYRQYDLQALPVMADDLLFDIGTDQRAVFDFVYQISYGTNEDDATENLCVDYFKTQRGSCYTHAAMLCYLYNRIGLETLRLSGESAVEGAGSHSWCLTKTEQGWRHFDAQYFTTRSADDQYGVTDDTYYGWFHWDKNKFPAAE